MRQQQTEIRDVDVDYQHTRSLAARLSAASGLNAASYANRGSNADDCRILLVSYSNNKL